MAHRLVTGLSAGLALGVVLMPVPSAAWVVRSHGTGGYGVAVSIVLAPDGNPIVGGALGESSSLQTEAHIAKHAASDGSELWTYVSGGIGSDLASALQIDAAGDVFAILTLYRAADVYDTAVVKVSGTDGTELWRRDFGGPGYQQAFSMALTSTGDPILAMAVGPSSSVGTVLRFDGATGATLWSTPFVGINGDGQPNAVALDAADDVVAVGTASDTSLPYALLVAKLDGATGAVQWRSGLDVSNGSNGYAVAVDGVGDVVAAGQNTRLHPPDDIYNDMFPVVAKFAGATGAQLWAYDDLTGFPDHIGIWATGLAIDAGDDVYATGLGDSSLLALRIEGDTGLPTWRRDVTGVITDIHLSGGVGEGVVVGPGGVPVFSGDLGNRFSAIALDPTTGETLWLQDLPGDNNNSGRIYGLALDPAGWVLGAGISTFPFIPDQGNQTNEYTVVRWVDPLSPPAVVGNCTPAPRGDCKPAPSRKSSLSMKDLASSKHDLIKWKWTAADVTTTADFGNPLVVGTDFNFCLYDATTAQIFGAVVAGDGACTGGVECWRALGSTGFRYRAKTREIDGVHDLILQSGAPGKGRIVLKRKGRTLGDLPMPNLPGLTLPLTVQLQRSGGACFGATFSTAALHDPTRLTAKSD